MLSIPLEICELFTPQCQVHFNLNILEDVKYEKLHQVVWLLWFPGVQNEPMLDKSNIHKINFIINCIWSFLNLLHF